MKRTLKKRGQKKKKIYLIKYIAKNHYLKDCHHHLISLMAYMAKYLVNLEPVIFQEKNHQKELKRKILPKNP